ncbi:DUF2637 domain-containing protein [[Kitasatospora] papulosa]|uniref:DUF2637 domain-containing protein n=1 Tax=Streptomyces TaxID=1883 RepID=UPI002251BA4D|nr:MULTISPECIES: DUF2637 domain-containing protein [Streptomyces]MCX4417887.1 DUF2637 domain-containing protein [[Kitasatospora] papulosa]MCY1677098.1 DUF2637 domain-containing protein [Streptomyces sp. SL294]
MGNGSDQGKCEPRSGRRTDRAPGHPPGGAVGRPDHRERAPHGRDRYPTGATTDPTNLTADPLRALSHGVMPVLFVLGVEAARRLLMHAARIKEGTASDRIPLHRWVLAPVRTGRLYRRMRLAAVTSYPEMVEREQALAGYKVWLTHELGGTLSKASETQLLPITMASYGYTVEEALALPSKWEAEAEERAEQEAERQREQAKRDRITALTDEADIAEAEHQVAARTGTAAAQATAATAQAQAGAEAARTRAELQKTAAERQARAEADALESAEAAAARRDAAQAQEQAAEAELRATRIREEAARTAAEAERREQDAERTAGQRADRHRQQAQAEHQDAETELRTAQLREQAARIEATAQEREDYARLTPRERSERRVAHLLLAATPAGQDTQIDAVPLATIQEELSVGRTTASELRTAALGLIQGGYRP